MDDTLHSLLAAQDGLITRKQALETLSVSALRHLLATRWQILLPGVYLATTGEPTYRQRLRVGLLYGGSTAQLADTTALRGYGVRYLPVDRTVRLLLSAAAKRTNRDGVEARRTHRLEVPRMVGGLPHCPPGRALAEFAARVGEQRTAVAVIADAVHRGVVSDQALALQLPHLTGRGANVARRAIEDVLGGISSAPEADFSAICSRSRILPPPLLNALLRLPDGRRIRPDALWRDAALVHETNSREHHAREDLFEHTQARHDAMTAAGLTVFHNTPAQQRREADRIVRQLEASYLRLAGRGLPEGVVLLSA
ncbi:MAG TPA: hypothetical protein VME70_06675 [Mycobacteriales bacterium]|nr:hypothetical protein [Mycobacteriales bacterium]